MTWKIVLGGLSLLMNVFFVFVVLPEKNWWINHYRYRWIKETTRNRIKIDLEDYKKWDRAFDLLASGDWRQLPGVKENWLEEIRIEIKRIVQEANDFISWYSKKVE